MSDKLSDELGENINNSANLPALSKHVSELVLAGSLHHAEQAFSDAVEQHGDLVVAEDVLAQVGRGVLRVGHRHDDRDLTRLTRRPVCVG